MNDRSELNQMKRSKLSSCFADPIKFGAEGNLQMTGMYSKLKSGAEKMLRVRDNIYVNQPMKEHGTLQKKLVNFKSQRVLKT